MLRKTLTLMIFSFLTLYSEAQDFEGGISGGINASWISNITNKGYQLWSFQGGAFTQTSMGKNFGLRFEIRYSKEGNHIKPKENGDYTIVLHYIDLPISYVYKTTKKNLNSKVFYEPFFIAGLSLGYLIKANEGFTNNDVSEEPFHSFSKSDFASHVGLGSKFSSHFSIELRYSISVFPIRNDFNDNVFISGIQRNNVVSGNLYYTF